MEEITLKPVGIVRSEYEDVLGIPIGGNQAIIEVFPEYQEALLRIEANSHLWIISWFHKARREQLSTVPARVNPDLPVYGVFGLRAPARPNPLGLSLVRLEAREGNILRVSGLDAVDGTPILDIKSYFENDIIFSPLTPYIRPQKLAMRREMFMKQALNHHQEECPGLWLGVRMALAAEERLGHLNQPSLRVKTVGTPCLADTIQGLTRARLANPPRFSYQESEAPFRTVWEKDGQLITIETRRDITRDEFEKSSDAELFQIQE
ncbi:MAG: tRNA (N6-threonylcarbamoyladenosine(37)-N6)-methyltransferase TrmO [Syntrophothermaceae bacterium]